MTWFERFFTLKLEGTVDEGVDQFPVPSKNSVATLLNFFKSPCFDVDALFVVISLPDPIVSIWTGSEPADRCVEAWAVGVLALLKRESLPTTATVEPVSPLVASSTRPFADVEASAIESAIVFESWATVNPVVILFILEKFKIPEDSEKNTPIYQSEKMFLSL